MTQRLGRAAVPLGRIAFFLAMIGGWWVATRFLDPLTLPRPSEVVREILPILKSPTFREDLLVSIKQIVAAIAIASVIGLTIGTLGWRFSSFKAAMFPWLAIGNAVPTILLYPVAIVVLGLGSQSIVALSVFMGSMAIAENTYAGLTAVNMVYLEVAECYEASSFQRFRKVLLPGAIEAVATGFRVGFAAVFVLVVATGYILSGSGLGYRLRFFYEGFQMPQLYALVLIIAVLALACQGILLLLLAWLRRGNSIRLDDVATLSPAAQI